MRFLILTYYWPPSGGAGVQRWLKMSNELVRAGHEVTVLTPQDGAYPSLDESLLSEVDERVRVIHTSTREPFRLFNLLRGQKGKSISTGLTGMKDSPSPIQQFAIWLRANFFIPDARKGWRPFAFKAAKSVIESSGVDVVITSGPPHSIHQVGQDLKKRFGLTWVADFRDPWVNIHYHALMPMGPRAKKAHQRMEDDILRAADLVTVVSPSMKREFEDRAKKIAVVFNGYDEDDFGETDAVGKKEYFTLSYVGSLKPNQDIPALWQAISELCDSSTEFAEKFRLQIIGTKSAELLDKLRDVLPAHCVVDGGYMEHREAVKAMQTSSALLFIIPKSENNKGILTGKLFEYLASGRPILSIGPSTGDAAQILTDAGRSAMSEYDNVKEIKNQILQLFEAEEHLETLKTSIFSRKEQTAKLMTALRDLD